MVKLHTLGYWQLAVTWSLAVEEQFYLTLPWVIRFTSRKTLPYVLGVGVLLAPLIRMDLWFALTLKRDLFSGIPGAVPDGRTAVGALAACAVRDAACWEWLVAHKR